MSRRTGRPSLSATARAVGIAGLVGVAALGSAACGSPAEPAAVTPTRAAPSTVAPPPSPTPTTTTPAPAGPTVQQIAAALDAISPVRHPRDNTGSCAVTAGCLGLITGGTVSIYQWPDVSSASRYIGEGSGSADRIGPYVLSYRTNEQHSTSPAVRKAYADKVREMVGPAP
jgi:hypothetical protein